MMDGEEVYRARLEKCLEAAAASSLPQVRDRHLAAARSWLALLNGVLERKAGMAAFLRTVGTEEDNAMGETDFETPDPVMDAIEDGTPAVKAFRQSSGQSQHDVAVEAGMTEDRLAEIESGRKTATREEMAEIAATLHVPEDLLLDKERSPEDALAGNRDSH